jgi:hypothetical protein
MSHRFLLVFLLAILSLTLVGCPLERADDDDDSSADDDDDSATGGDDDDSQPSDVDGDGDGVTVDNGDCDDEDATIYPGADEVCDDSIDNDCDTLLDCADTDCETDSACWPETLEHDAVLSFTSALPLIEDCVTAFNATINAEGSSTKGECADCDRIYAGPLNYTEDTCSEAFGATPPTANRYGVAFRESGLLEIYGINAESGAWESLGDAPLNDNGWFVLTRTDPVNYDPLGEVGSLSTTLKFLIP